MRGARGFSLIEILVTTSVIVSLSATFFVVGDGIHRRERLSAAYAEDLAGLRRAVRGLHEDLRLARDLDDLGWRLDGATLRRDGKAIARNVARFDVSRDGALARVHLALGPRATAPARREACVEFVVHLRNHGRPR